MKFSLLCKASRVIVFLLELSHYPLVKFCHYTGTPRGEKAVDRNSDKEYQRKDKLNDNNNG